MSTVGVDFDGPIHAYSRGWHDGTVYDVPVPGAWRAIAAIQRRHAVFVFTSRSVLQVAAWLVESSPFQVRADPAARGFTGPKFWDDRDCLLVTNRKLPAVAYIDDRAVTYVDWDQTGRALRETGLL